MTDTLRDQRVDDDVVEPLLNEKGEYRQKEWEVRHREMTKLCAEQQARFNSNVAFCYVGGAILLTILSLAGIR